MVSLGDYLQRFHFKDLAVRGAFVSLSETLHHLSKNKSYPDAIATLLAEMLSANLLMSSTISWHGQLIMQYQAQPGSAVELLLAKSNDRHEVSALARWDESVTFPDSVRLERGRLVVSLLHEQQQSPSQSIIELTQEGVEACIQEYFYRIERIDTRLCLLGMPDQAYGLILQKMPDELCDFTALTSTMDNSMIDFSLPMPALLSGLFPGQDCYLNDPESVVFQCQCSLDKMKKALIMAGEAEIREELSLHPSITVTCEFCGHEYCFSQSEVDALFSDKDSTH